MMNNTTEVAEETIEDIIAKADGIVIDENTKKVILYVGGGVIVIALTTMLEKKFGFIKKGINKVKGIFKKETKTEEVVN